jgi:hypothetical protein
MTSATLQTLAQSVARPHYVTTPDDLELMKNLYREGDVKEMGEMALALFYQLREPGAGEQDEGGDGSSSEADVRRVLRRIREIFGLSPEPEPETSGQLQGSQQDAGATDADPAASSQPRGSDDADATEAEEEPDCGLSAAEWEAREPVRRLLEHILSRQVELCEAQRHATLRESLMGPSPYERAAEVAPTHPNELLMRRMQDSNFRQVWRVTNMLLKLKHQALEEEAW